MKVAAVNGVKHRPTGGMVETSHERRPPSVAPMGVIVASDMPFVRDAVAGWFADGHGMWQVTDVCSTSTRLLTALRRYPGSIAVVSDGILRKDDVLASVMALTPRPRLAVLVLSPRSDRREAEVRLVRAGIRVILGAEASETEMLGALSSLDAGGAILSAETVDAILQRRGPLLTKRQLEIVQLLATGESTVAIAEQLYVTPDTVRSHIRHIAHRCGLEPSIRIVAAHAQEILERSDTHSPGR